MPDDFPTSGQNVRLTDKLFSLDVSSLNYILDYEVQRRVGRRKSVTKCALIANFPLYLAPLPRCIYRDMIVQRQTRLSIIVVAACLPLENRHDVRSRVFIVKKV